MHKKEAVAGLFPLDQDDERGEELPPSRAGFRRVRAMGERPRVLAPGSGFKEPAKGVNRFLKLGTCLYVRFVQIWKRRSGVLATIGLGFLGGGRMPGLRVHFMFEARRQERRS